ncbi:hypothetical protein [Parathalassolituus penaei]|uniref:Uncharacterized protein n=1 Tax=Parathalassolituus penaei TaxID=2997323 RepID=A0A9X3IST2_9GAMM|nr:hypothetical protein [Parathalassolituus penaei]MCY0966156.1 hypothetical protein [Parathalassolituus penaei]
MTPMNTENGAIAVDHWLLISPCYSGFEDCDTVQVEVNEDLIDVDVVRIPDLIRALEYAYQLATQDL